MLFDDITYSVILTSKNIARVELSGAEVSVEAGYPLQDFVRVMVVNEYAGFEGLEGIPASIGGAVLMNLGPMVIASQII